MRLILSILIAAGLIAPAGAAGPDDVGGRLTGLRWISYAPTNYFPAESPPVLPSDESLRADLRVLRDAGFNGLITYGAQLDRLPAMARRAGFTAMLLGVWDPSSRVERANAVAAVRGNRDFVAGIIVGNEGLLTGRYTIDALCQAMRDIAAATGKPVSTTEPVDWVLSERRIAECSTFVTVNAHPLFSNQHEATGAVRWTVDAWDAIRARIGSKPLLFKEVGLPSGGSSEFTQDSQREYYVALALTPVVFSYFEAFDATPRFKSEALEQSWGLWTSTRAPKLIVDALPWRDSAGAGQDARSPNPYQAEGAAREAGRSQSLGELRATVRALASSAEHAVDFCTVAELYKLIGDTAAGSYYEACIAKDPEEPAYELLYGDYLRLYRGAGQRPLFPAAEKHLEAALMKLDRRAANQAARRAWDPDTAVRVRRSLAALYERDGFQLASRTAGSQTQSVPWLFLSPTARVARSASDFDRGSDARDFTSAALFSASRARLQRPLTNAELGRLVRDVLPFEIGATARLRRGSAPVVDVSVSGRHTTNAQVTDFYRPSGFNDLALTDVGVAFEKPLTMPGATDALFAFQAHRINRKGLVEFLPDTAEHISQFAGSGALSHYVGPDRVGGTFTYVRQAIEPDGNGLANRDRTFTGGSVTYQLFRPVFGRNVVTGLGRRFEPRGIDLFAGVLDDTERFPAPSSDVFITRRDYFVGITLHGLGRVDATMQPTWYESRVSNDQSQFNSQLRVAGTIVTRILDEERTAGMPSERFAGMPVAFVQIVVPFHWDAPLEGLAAFRSRRVGAELWTKFLTNDFVSVTTLAVFAYSRQHFPELGKGVNLLTARFSVGF